MSELLNFYSSEQYNIEIEEIVERTSMSYLDAMLYHADENGLCLLYTSDAADE